jgi:hypothetical protein
LGDVDGISIIWIATAALNPEIDNNYIYTILSENWLEGLYIPMIFDRPKQHCRRASTYAPSSVTCMTPPEG